MYVVELRLTPQVFPFHLAYAYFYPITSFLLVLTLVLAVPISHLYPRLAEPAYITVHKVPCDSHSQFYYCVFYSPGC